MDDQYQDTTTNEKYHIPDFQKPQQATIEGSFILEPKKTQKKSLMQKRASLSRKSKQTSLKMLTELTPNERSHQIQVLANQVQQYQRLMYLIALNSAWSTYSYNLCLYYCRSVLGASGADYSIFVSIMSIPWYLKPLWGFLSDSFFVFGYRFKSHCVLMSLLMIAPMLSYLLHPTPNLTYFTICQLVYNFGVAYVDALAEGISAVVTKLRETIQLLEEFNRMSGAYDKDSDLYSEGYKQRIENSVKALGTFNAVKSFFSSFMTFLGGFLITFTPLSLSGVVLAAYPVIFAVAVIFVFREEKKNYFFNGCLEFRMGLYYTLRTIITPQVLLPFLYMILVTTPPTAMNDFSYVLLGPGGWSFELYNSISLYSNILLSILFLLMVRLGDFVRFNQLMLMSQIMVSFSVVLGGLCLYAYEVSHWLFSVFWLFQMTLYNLGFNLTSIVLVGRVSTFLADGYESTGVAVVIAANNFANSLRNQFSGSFLDYYNVGNGYYWRLKTPQFYSSLAMIGYVLVAPMFLFQ